MEMEFLLLVVVALLTPGLSFSAVVEELKPIAEDQAAPVGPVLPEAGAYIVGGSTVGEAWYPWQASVQVNREHVCGATLIHRRWLITAAHCLNSTSSYTVVLGTRTLNYGDGYRRYAVAEQILYPTYNVALIKLAKDAYNATYIKPIGLANEGEVYQNVFVFITGWGENAHTAPLQRGIVSVYTTEYCRAVIRSVNAPDTDARYDVREYEICAGKEERSVACNGDYGGPLAYHKDGFKLVGVSTWSVPGCDAFFPAVYTRILDPNVRGWIRNNTGV